jgi:hypothetical protein
MSDPNTELPNFYTSKEVMKLARCGRTKLAYMVKNHTFPMPQRSGRQLLWNKHGLVEFFDNGFKMTPRLMKISLESSVNKE